MKKFFYLLLLLIPLGLTSCHDDDDDLPNVDFDVTFQDAAIGEDGVIYVVQGESFSIEGVKVINREAGKSAIITSATYFWDAFPLGTSVVEPYGFEIETSSTTPLGNHSLQISCPVYAVDKEMATALISFTVCVVADENELPDDTTSDEIIQHRIVTPSIND